MLAGVEPNTLIPAVFIILAASLVKSTTGFGFAMVSMPLLLLLWDPSHVVPILLPLMITIDALIVAQNRRQLEFRRVAPMAAAGAVGIPMGTYALLSVPTQALKLGVAGLILVSAVLLLREVTITLSRERLASGIAGFLSGLLITSTALSGPPVALFMINQQWAKHTFRNSLGLFFLSQDIFAIISLTATGALHTGTLRVSAMLWPSVLLGYLIATLLLPHISQRTFLRTTALVVMAAAVLAIANALW